MHGHGMFQTSCVACFVIYMCVPLEDTGGVHEKLKVSNPRSSLRNLSCYGGSLSRGSLCLKSTLVLSSCSFFLNVSCLFIVPTERWCRLRGNLLFFFKSSEVWSNPAGVFILDIENIQVDPVPSDGVWPFTLSMPIQKLSLFSF